MQRIHAWFCLLLIQLLWSMPLSAQLVLEYTENLPEQIYNECLEKEQHLHDSTLLVQGESYLQLARKVRRYQEVLSKEYALKASELFGTLGEDSLLAITRSHLSMVYTGLSDLAKAKSQAEMAITYFSAQGDSLDWSNALIRSARVEIIQGDLHAALALHLQAKAVQQDILSVAEMGDIYNRLIDNYNRLQDYESALQYFDEYRAAPGSDNKYMGVILINAALAYQPLGRLDSARTALNNALKYWKHSRSYRSKITIYQYLSNIAELENDFGTAVKYIDTALAFARQWNNAQSLAEVISAKYELKEALGQNQEMLSQMLEANRYAKQSKEVAIQQNISQQLAQLYADKRNYQAAYDYLAIADSLSAIQYTEQLADEVRNLEKKMIREQSEKEIALLNEQNSLKTENLSKAKRLRNFLVALLLLAALSLSLVFFLFRQRTRNNALLKQKNATITRALEENKFLIKEVHHRVKNNLQVVSSLLSLQSRYVNDESALSAIRTGKARVQAMSILHQNLYSNEDLKAIRIQDYFEDLGQNLFDTYQVGDKDIRFISHVNDISLDVDLVIPIGLIVNELMSNALKHAFSEQEEGYVSLSISQLDDQLLVEVQDNGKGLPFKSLPEKSDSLGALLIKSFCKKINARLEIQNAVGTTFRLHIPIDQK